MAILITWLPNPEADIASYDLERSSDGSTFAQLALIAHSLTNPSVYDSATGRFFYSDATGVAVTHYYRIRAIDAAGNYSAYTTIKQPSSPTPAVCVVFGTVVNADGTPNTDVCVLGEVVSTKDSKDGQLVDEYGVTGDQVETFTNDEGFFELALLQGSTMILSIPKIDLKREICVPTSISVNFQTLI